MKREEMKVEGERFKSYGTCRILSSLPTGSASANSAVLTRISCGRSCVESDIQIHVRYGQP